MPELQGEQDTGQREKEISSVYKDQSKYRRNGGGREV